MVELMETTTGRLSPSAGSPSDGKTRRLNSQGEHAHEKRPTPEGRERARESEERTSASAEDGGRDLEAL